MISKLQWIYPTLKPENTKEDYIVKGLSNDINYNVKPKQAYVTLENKETKTMHVQADIGKMI